MKKLLSVMLVLGLVSTAFALPTISGPTSILKETAGTYTYTVTGTAAEATIGYQGGVFANLATNNYYSSALPSGVISINANNVILIDPGTGNPRMGDVAGGIAMLGTYYAGVDFVAGSGTVIKVVAGDWFTFDLIVDATIPEQVIRLDLSDMAYTTTSGYLDVTVVPEPMTIALLGLGGLFLRRRK